MAERCSFWRVSGGQCPGEAVYECIDAEIIDGRLITSICIQCAQEMEALMLRRRRNGLPNLIRLVRASGETEGAG